MEKRLEKLRSVDLRIDDIAVLTPSTGALEARKSLALCFQTDTEDYLPRTKKDGRIFPAVCRYEYRYQYFLSCSAH